MKREKTNKTYKSEILETGVNSEKIINARFKILIGIILALMTILLIRLYQVQIQENASYTAKLDIYNTRYQTVTTPRGEMLDANGLVLVGNKQKLNITYLPPENVTSAEEWYMAWEFSQNFEIDISSLNDRDKQDLFLATQTSGFASFVATYQVSEFSKYQSSEIQLEYANLITDEEMEEFYDGQLSDTDIYTLRLSRISQTTLDNMSDNLLKIWYVKSQMDQASSGLTKIIKADASKEETAYLMEHSNTFVGFDVEINWDREYPFDDMLKGVLGSVTTSSQGLPEDELDYYLALGYVRNDRVGKSGLEKEYEDLLSGEKAVYEVNYTDGIGDLTEVDSGSKGYDLQLTIDADLQKFVDEQISETLLSYSDDETREYLDRINIVVTNPQNGDILAMSSMVKDDEDNVYSDPVACYTSAYPVGSVVKGATVYMGLDQGVVTKDEIIVDQPFKIKATPIKSSWKNLGEVNAVMALAESSNVYMFNLAVRLAGGYYTYDGPLYVADGTFSMMRNYYSLFGLGELTGLDVPNEAIGYMGSSQTAGNILDYVIGQYDNYTTVMLAQYISTIANGGYKLQPRLVSKAYISNTDKVVYENPVTVLNTLDNLDALETVREGMYACVNGGLCYGIDNSYKEQVAGKTGTAQDYVYVTNEDGSVETIQTPNNSYVTFAPYDNPTVATACIAPKAWNGYDGQSNPCLAITNAIYDYYLFNE